MAVRPDGPGGPERPLPQYSTDRRWWWDGREWRPASPPVPSPAASTAPIRPGRWLYLPAALAVVTAVVLVALVVQGFRTGFPGGAVHVTAPGTTEIMLSEPGDYTISYEHRIAGAGWSLEASSEPARFPAELSSMHLQLVSAATGTPVAFRRVQNRLTYQQGSTEGIGIAVFKVDQPGAYRLSSEYADGRSEPSVVLAIARGSPGDVAVHGLELLAALGLSLAAAAIWGITLFLRLRARDRARAANVV